jgi:drug/metabolite transporter (DMT)-like permease
MFAKGFCLNYDEALMNITQSRIIIAFAALYIIWGSTYLAIRFAIESLPPFLMAGLRFLIAGLILYAFAHYKNKEPRPSLVQWRSALIIGGLLLCGGNGSVVWAEQFVPSGLASLFIATTPLWMVLLEWLWHRGKRPAFGVFAGICVGFFGVWLLMAPTTGTQPIHLGGALMLLLAALLWSIGSIYSKRAPLPKSPLRGTGMEMIAGGAVLILLGIFSGELTSAHPSAFTLKSVWAFIYLIFFGSLVGFTAYIWLLKAVGAAKASTYAFVNPLVAVFLGWALGGEMLSAQTIAAALIIVAAVVVITRYQREEQAVAA